MQPLQILSAIIFVTLLFGGQNMHAEISDLAVTARLASKSVTVNKPFSVQLDVKNSSRNIQKIHVMSCSWPQHWKPSISEVSIIVPFCTRNVETTLTLKPGEIYSRKLDLIVYEKPTNPISFRLGFQPMRSKITFWSDKVSPLISQ